MSYKILVDSSCDIPQEVAAKAGIVVVPMPVYIDGKSFLEGVDIFTDRFYADFQSYKELPKTSQPNPNELRAIYENLLEQGHEIVAIHLSSGLSSTYQTAVMVKDMCSQPDKIHVIDSLGASLGFGLLAYLASEIVKQDAEWAVIEQQLLQVRNNMCYVFTLDTLEYLVKGGRVSKTAGFVAGLLDVKPILHINDEGKIDVFGKVRSRKAAIRKLIELMEQEAVNPENQIVAISHAACQEEAEALASEVRQKFNVKDIIMGEIGCVVGSHVGPGTLALFYQTEK